MLHPVAAVTDLCGVDATREALGTLMKVLAVEAAKTVVFEKEEMIHLADKYGISIVGISKEPQKD